MPADRPDRIAKAAGLTGAAAPGALILDLEDGVAPSARRAARDGLAAALAEVPDGAPQILVRIDARTPATAFDDAAAVAALGPRVGGVVVPGATVAMVTGVAGELDRTGRHDLMLTALVETAAGLLELVDLARHPRVVRLALGEADLAADLGMAPGPDGIELLALRTQAVVASAAGGLGGPTGPVATDFRDVDSLRRSSEALRRLGYSGRSCIHPDQVPVVNEVFTPSEEELEQARELVALFDAALARGEGATTGPDGRMVDEAVVRRARRLLAD